MHVCQILLNLSLNDSDCCQQPFNEALTASRSSPWGRTGPLEWQLCCAAGFCQPLCGDTRGALSNVMCVGGWGWGCWWLWWVELLCSLRKHQCFQVNMRQRRNGSMSCGGHDAVQQIRNIWMSFYRLTCSLCLSIPHPHFPSSFSSSLLHMHTLNWPAHVWASVVLEQIPELLIMF